MRWSSRSISRSAASRAVAPSACACTATPARRTEARAVTGRARAGSACRTTRTWACSATRPVWASTSAILRWTYSTRSGAMLLLSSTTAGRSGSAVGVRSARPWGRDQGPRRSDLRCFRPPFAAGSVGPGFDDGATRGGAHATGGAPFGAAARISRSVTARRGVDGTGHPRPMRSTTRGLWLPRIRRRSCSRVCSTSTM